MPVQVHSLPCFTGSDFSPGPKRLMLPQGEMSLLHPACPEIRTLCHLVFQKNTKRGGHYHREKTEYLYLITGEVSLSTRDRETGEQSEFSLKGGDLVVITPNIEHSYLCTVDGIAVEFTSFAPNPADTIKV